MATKSSSEMLDDFRVKSEALGEARAKGDEDKMRALSRETDALQQELYLRMSF